MGNISEQKKEKKMKKIWIKLIILVVIVLIVVIGIRLAKKTITGEGVIRIAEKAIESVEEKAKEAEEKVSSEEAEVTTEEAEAPAEEVSMGKMNDDIWVEIFAYAQYRLAKYGEEIEKAKTITEQTRVAEKYGKDTENMYKKFGVTEDEFSAYTEKLGENPERYMKLIERANQRVEELKKSK